MQKTCKLQPLHLYLQFQENLMHLIPSGGFWFVHMLFGSLVKFSSLAQFSVVQLSHPVMSSFVFFVPFCCICD